MKKLLFLSLAALFAFPAVNVAASDFDVIRSNSSSMLLAEAPPFNVFRRFRSNDGREFYFYPEGKCEGFDNGRLMFTARYKIIQSIKELRILDENGNTIYKGSYSLADTRKNYPYQITLGGTSYRLVH